MTAAVRVAGAPFGGDGNSVRMRGELHVGPPRLQDRLDDLTAELDARS